ncbi:MAG: sigma-70 family RNA polymerase sigma factor [Spirochaetes bacterium]|nr:sigma-70 family RNA polymerase sigma factor [Spirochaetota bacterium]
MKAKKKEDYKIKIRESLNEDILSIYLKEINKIPLLTREEEEYLAKRAMKGNEQSKQHLIQANLRFVVSIAKKYQVSGISLIDLINEGNLGLIIAADKFDYRKGYHFISYAVWWIRQSILKAIAEKSRLIRLPLNRSTDIRKIEESINKLTSKLKRLPSASEIADQLDMDNEEVNTLLSAAQGYVSLESPIGNDNSSVLSDIVSDTTGPRPEDNVMANSLAESLNDALNSLSETERIVINLRYGLNNNKRMSLEKIGKKFGLSKERIRQIEKKAIKRLKHPNRSQKVKTFLG